MRLGTPFSVKAGQAEGGQGEGAICRGRHDLLRVSPSGRPRLLPLAARSVGSRHRHACHFRKRQKKRQKRCHPRECGDPASRGFSVGSQLSLQYWIAGRVCGRPSTSWWPRHSADGQLPPSPGEGGSARAAQRGATGWGEFTTGCGRGEITPPRLTSRFARCEATLPLQGRVAVRAWHRSTQRLKQLIGISVRVPATRFASELCERSALSKMEGAGKAGCWLTPMARLQKRMQAAVTTGTSRTTGLPCAMALRLIRDLPGDRLDCPRHPRARRLPRI